MKRLAFLVAAAVLAGPAAAVPLDQGVRPITLQNGMLVLLAPDSTAGAADVALLYRAGARDEKPPGSGLAYLFGRLMYGPTATLPAGEFRRRLEAQGATLNSNTNPDYASFYETLPGEAIDLALELESDRMTSLQLAQAGLDEARRAVQDERRLRLSLSPVVAGLQTLYETAFDGHPYEYPVIGNPSALARLTLADAQAHYRGRFSPDRAVLTVTGRFDPERVLGEARRRFESLPRRPASDTTAVLFPVQKGERRGFTVAATDQLLLFVGWRGPAAADPDSPAMDGLAEILTGGISSRLHAIAAKRVQFDGLEGGYDRAKDASLLFCVGRLRDGADSTASEPVLIDAVEALAKEPVSDQDLERAKRRIETHTRFSWQTARGRAEALAEAQLLEGDYRAAEKRLDRVRRLTPADIQRVAARVLRENARSVVWVASSADGGKP